MPSELMDSSFGPGNDLEGSGLLTQVQEWMQQCQSNHKLCEHILPPVTAQAAITVPTRLVQVGPSHDSYPLRLCLSNPERVLHKSKSEPCPHWTTNYATLSYCWGRQGQNFATTKTNLHQHLQELILENLPRTIQQAISFCRSLGIHYLWVDALCIIQPTEGDIADWQYEASRMGQYYRNSLLTIAATGASGYEGGLSIRRSNNMSYEEAVKKAPLLSRGWALQELVLSRRILHFTGDIVYWDCYDRIASERHPICLPTSIHTSTGIRLARRRVATIKTTENADWSVFSVYLWYKLIEQYSAMGLTHPTDTFPAVSGLAKEFNRDEQDVYIAGIWKSSFISGLCWKPDLEKTDSSYVVSKEYIAPSWSWGAQRRAISYGLALYGKVVARFSDAMVDAEGADSYGRLRHGWLRISGPMKELHFARPTDHNGPDCGRRVVKLSETGSHGVLRLDTVDALPPDECCFVCLQLRRKDGDSLNNDRHIALLLSAVDGSTDTFRRVGHTELRSKNIDGQDTLFGSTEWKTITII